MRHAYVGVFVFRWQSPFPRCHGSGSSRSVLHALILDPQQLVENVAGLLSQDTPAFQAINGQSLAECRRGTSLRGVPDRRNPLWIVTATAASVDWDSLSPTHRVPDCFTEGLGSRGAFAPARAQLLELLELCSETRGSFVPRNVQVDPGRYRNGRWISSRPPDPQREKHIAACIGQSGQRRSRSALVDPSLAVRDCAT